MSRSSRDASAESLHTPPERRFCKVDLAKSAFRGRDCRPYHAGPAALALFRPIVTSRTRPSRMRTTRLAMRQALRCSRPSPLSRPGDNPLHRLEDLDERVVTQRRYSVKCFSGTPQSPSPAACVSRLPGASCHQRCREASSCHTPTRLEANPCCDMGPGIK